MQRVILLLMAVVVVGCATDSPPKLDYGKVTYYDRNHDGRVDFEFHDNGGGDTDWAVADRDYDGYYDILLWYGIAGAAIYKHHKPVPTGVKITKGPVPVLITDYGQSVSIPPH
jgi:hypothetical protein